MPKKPILIVEDDRDIRENLKELLESENYSVALASNGAIALEMIRSGQVSPCLIFLDLMMPVMDGRKFLKEFHQEPEAQSIPVVILTADVEPVEGQVSAIIKKPVDLDAILEAIAKYSRDA